MTPAFAETPVAPAEPRSTVLRGGIGPLLDGSHAAAAWRQPSMSELIDLLRAAGLTGRGGGGFPVWRKLATLPRRGRPPVVIANGSEGEPLSRKDRVLAASNPDLVLDGLLIVAGAATARRTTIVGRTEVLDPLRAARDRRADAHSIAVAQAGPIFPSGEASAVANIAAGGPALPLNRTRPIAERGPDRAATFVSNIETFAAIALVVRHGAAWFRAMGENGEPGTRLVTVSGDVVTPGVTEIRAGESVASVIARAGGAESGSSAIVGGYSGGWLHEPQWNVPYADAALLPLGARTGAGIVHVLGANRDPLLTASSVLGYLASQSARQCGPCMFGLPALAAAFDAFARGAATPAQRRRIEMLASQVDHRGACHHPDGAAAFARATLAAFANRFQTRDHGGRVGV